MLSDGGLVRVRSETASAEQRASFLAALALLGRLSSVCERIGKRVLDKAVRRGRGETTKALEAKLVAGLRCTGWFLLCGSAWIVSNVFAA